MAALHIYTQQGMYTMVNNMLRTADRGKVTRPRAHEAVLLGLLLLPVAGPAKMTRR